MHVRMYTPQQGRVCVALWGACLCAPCVALIDNASTLLVSRKLRTTTPWFHAWMHQEFFHECTHFVELGCLLFAMLRTTEYKIWDSIHAKRCHVMMCFHEYLRCCGGDAGIMTVPPWWIQTGRQRSHHKIPRVLITRSSSPSYKTQEAVTRNSEKRTGRARYRPTCFMDFTKQSCMGRRKI